MWIFTREQIKMLQERCNFLNQSSASREFMSSFSVWDHCRFKKIIPAQRLLQYMIQVFDSYKIIEGMMLTLLFLCTISFQHYYHQKHVSWYPTYVADENLRAGTELD